MNLRLLLPALALVISGCSWFGDGPADPPATLTDFEPRVSVHEDWTANLGKGPGEAFLRLRPAILDNMLYAADLRGVVRALSRENGHEQWETSLGLEVTAGVGVNSDLVVVGTRKGVVVALDRKNGQERWRSQVTSEVLAAPAVAAGVVVVQSVDGRLSAFDEASGKQLWSVERSEPTLSLRGTASPVILSDVVFSGFASGKLVAASLRDGRVLWELPVTQAQGRSEIERLVDVDVPVLVVGRMVIAAAYQGKMVAMSLDNGRLLWSREFSVYEPLTSDGRNIYVADARGHVYALDARSGATVWSQEKLHGRRLSGPAVDGNAVAVGDYEGYVHWLATDDGRFLARERVSRSAVLSAPLVMDDHFYVSTQNGNLAALRLKPLAR